MDHLSLPISQGKLVIITERPLAINVKEISCWRTRIRLERDTFVGVESLVVVNFDTLRCCGMVDINDRRLRIVVSSRWKKIMEIRACLLLDGVLVAGPD